MMKGSGNFYQADILGYTQQLFFQEIEQMEEQKCDVKNIIFFTVFVYILFIITKIFLLYDIKLDKAHLRLIIFLFV